MSFCNKAPFAGVADKALIGTALGCIAVAVRGLVVFINCSSALKKIRDAPCVDVSGLRSVLLQQSADSPGGGEALVVVRGTVGALAVEKREWIESVAVELSVAAVDQFGMEGWIKFVIKEGIGSDMKDWLNKFLKGRLIKWAVDRQWINPTGDGLLDSSSGEKAVILRNTQSCICNGIFSAKNWREGWSETRAVPFALKEGDRQSQSDYLIVDIGNSKHLLPLVTVNRHIQAISGASYTFLQGLFRRDVVGLLDEEKILPPGKEITALGVCCLKDAGVPEMKPCSNLPYFLSNMSKEEMIADMERDMEDRMWLSIVFGFASIVILSYVIARKWSRWKERQQRATRVREQVH